MINVFVNYYEEKNLDRKKELDLCIKNNMNNALINFIMLESDKRLKYNDYFKFVNSYTSNDDINVISNLDIYFDDTVSLLSGMKQNEAFALRRYELQEDGSLTFKLKVDSQDVWVFKGRIKNIYGDFYLGVPGCDNRIAYEISKAGYKLSNPAYSVKTIHVHNSMIRNYTQQNRVPRPYKNVPVSHWNKR